MTFIDGGLPDIWPLEVLEATKRFHQGDLVENPPFHYAGAAGYGIWDLTRSGTSQEQEQLFELHADDRPAYGILTSQTCDIQEEHSPKRPWVSVSPVWDVTDTMPAGQKGNVVSGRVVHLVKLDAPDFIERFWVADLRIDVPIEKSWLVGREARAGFSSDRATLDFSQRLSARVARPALADTVVRGVTSPLRKWLDKSKDGSVHSDVDEVRVLLQGTLEVPTSAELLVLSDNPHSDDVRAVWNNWWSETVAEDVEQGEVLAHLPPRLSTFDELSAKDYRNSVLLNFAYLSPDEG